MAVEKQECVSIKEVENWFCISTHAHKLWTESKLDLEENPNGHELTSCQHGLDSHP